VIDVTGVGANSMDHVLRIPGDVASLAVSGKRRILSQQWCCGGQTATAMSACAAFGLRAAYVGAFGADAHGQRLRAELSGRGVDVQHASDGDAANPGAVIVVDDTGRRTVLWHRDDRLALTPEQIPAGVLKQSRLIHVDDVDRAAALYACLVARSAGIPVTSDIEQVADGPAGTEALVRAVTYPMFDHNAPALLTGERDPERALRKLRRLNPGLLCMTLGEEGAAALEGDVFHAIPAERVTAVDTTGAGDVFRAGMIYGLLRGWDVPALLRFANAAAAISCTREGAIASVPSLADVEKLMSQPEP
jgi:sugar/nucleoside kinase (ribokinase family)